MTWDTNIVIGEDWTRVVTLTSGGTPIDITSYTIEFIGFPDNSISLSTGSGITHTDPTAGEFTMAIDKTVTATYTKMRGRYQIWWTPSGGDRTVLLAGELNVTDGFQ